MVRPRDFRRLVKVAAHSELGRDAAILYVLYDAGLRVSELTALKTGDVLLNGLLKIVRRKGSRGRLVPVSRRTARQIHT